MFSAEMIAEQDDSSIKKQNGCQTYSQKKGWEFSVMSVF
jgi:hypothetical protein